MAKKLTPKQIKFALVYIETGNATEAYRQSYKVTTTNHNTLNKKANELSNHPAIKDYIKQIQERQVEEHMVTVESLSKELDEARDMARRNLDPKAMIGATMGKAKIYGLDKQVVEHKGDLSNLQPVIKLSMGGVK